MNPHELRFDLANLARVLAVAKGDWAHAVPVADQLRVPDRVARVIRAAVTAGELDPETAANLTDLTDASDAFTFNLRGLSFFDTIRTLPGHKTLPPRRQGPAIIGSAVAGRNAEAGLKSISSLSISQGDLELFNVAGLVYLSTELARVLKLAVLNGELSRAVSAAADLEVLQALLAETGIVSQASTGDPVVDIRNALAVMPLTAASKVFVLAHPNVISTVALWPGDTSGSLAFAGLGILGGEANGLTFFPTDNLPDDSPRTMVVIDVSKVATAADPIRLNVAKSATLFEGDGGATDPAISLWQRNLIGVRAERFIGVSLAQPTSVVTVSGAEYA
jgi:hypothetical protein